MVMVPYATTGKIVTGGTDGGQLVLLQRKHSPVELQPGTGEATGMGGQLWCQGLH